MKKIIIITFPLIYLPFLFAAKKAPNIEIIKAIKSKNIQTIKKHLGGNTTINEYYQDCLDGCLNTTPLILAIESGNLEIVKLLVNNNASLSLPYYSGPIYAGAVYTQGSPLMRAIEYENIDIIKYLLDMKVNVSYSDSYGHTALHKAIYSCNLDILKLLIKHKIDLNTKTILPYPLHFRHDLIIFSPNKNPVEFTREYLGFLINEINYINNILTKHNISNTKSLLKSRIMTTRKINKLRLIISYLKELKLN